MNRNEKIKRIEKNAAREKARFLAKISELAELAADGQEIHYNGVIVELLQIERKMAEYRVYLSGLKYQLPENKKIIV